MSLFRKGFTVTWIIKNFSFLKFNGIYFEAPIFTAENFECDWCIFIFDCKACLSLRLDKLRKVNKLKALKLDIEMELCNSGNEVLCVMKKTGFQFNEADDYCGFDRLMLMEELFKKMKADPGDTLVLRCRMWETGERETAGGTLSRSRTIKTTKHTDEQSYIRMVDYSESLDWTQKLTFPIREKEVLNVNIKSDQDDILFEIERNIVGKSQVTKCEISLFDDKGKVKFSSYDVFNFSENNKIWHFPSFLKRCMLEKKTCLILKFNFAYLNGVEFHDIVYETTPLGLFPSLEVFEKVPAINSLLDDFRKMLFSREQADVSFRVGSEVISAHKNVLAFRSPVFSAMFKQDMAERETGVIDVPDMDAQTLKLFLEFLYTGELEDSDCEGMLELLLAAEKYQVPSLKERCSQLLKRRFGPDSVCDVVSVADMVREHSLKSAAMDYIKGNVEKVFSSPKWTELRDKNVKLCSEIICKFSNELKGVKK